ARLVGRRNLATVEITLARDLGGGAWRVYAKGARRLRPDDRIDFAADFSAVVVDKTPEGAVTLRFDREGAAFRAALLRHGAMPLPASVGRALAAGASSRSARPACGSSKAPPPRAGRSRNSAARPGSSSSPATASGRSTCC